MSERLVMVCHDCGNQLVQADFCEAVDAKVEERVPQLQARVTEQRRELDAAHAKVAELEATVKQLNADGLRVFHERDQAEQRGHERGRREGLEEAAKICDNGIVGEPSGVVGGTSGHEFMVRVEGFDLALRHAATRIRQLMQPEGEAGK